MAAVQSRADSGSHMENILLSNITCFKHYRKQSLSKWTFFLDFSLRLADIALILQLRTKY